MKPQIDRVQRYPEAGPEIFIIIDDIGHYLVDTHLSGIRVKCRGFIDSSYNLFLKQSKNDILINDEDSIKLQNDMEFYSVPPATFGG